MLEILDRITAGIEEVDDRRSPGFAALRKGLGYCWSVAVVALPAEGKALMEKWLGHMGTRSALATPPPGA